MLGASEGVANLDGFKGCGGPQVFESRGDCRVSKGLLGLEAWEGFGASEITEAWESSEGSQGFGMRLLCSRMALPVMRQQDVGGRVLTLPLLSATVLLLRRRQGSLLLLVSLSFAGDAAWLATRKGFDARGDCGALGILLVSDSLRLRLPAAGTFASRLLRLGAGEEARSTLLLLPLLAAMPASSAGSGATGEAGAGSAP